LNLNRLPDSTRKRCRELIGQLLIEVLKSEIPPINQAEPEASRRSDDG
jgi:hypothetical protein